MSFNKIFVSGSKSSEDESHWLTVSDLMSGLMMIFLFISVSYMRFAQIERNKVIDVLATYQKTEEAIHNALKEEFANDFQRWNAELKDLTITFKAPEVLFDSNSVVIKEDFKNILNDFIPRYALVLDGFNNKIQEIRIEGHTSSEWISAVGEHIAYFNNMELSQGRTRSVLEYAYSILDMNRYDWLKSKLSAVGMSSARLVLNENGLEDSVASRRVEFNVLTNFQGLVVDQIKALEIERLKQ